jgi:Na(+)-translocating NADH:ubiquinone oxidoreductase A subunit
MSLDPFTARGDVQLRERLSDFITGLEHLQSLLEFQPIYLVMPDVRSVLAEAIRKETRGYAWVTPVETPLRYPYDNFAVLARNIGLRRNAGPVWAVRTEGVLASNLVLTSSLPSISRIISVGGPAVNDPMHVKAVPGYPIQAILENFVSERPAKAINGGILSGETLGPDILGLDTECRGITVLPEPEDREFLAFMRPGLDRQSYSRCFLSLLRRRHDERLTTAVRGEVRPCISCNFCEEICPAGIMPHLIHKYLYRDLIEGAEHARVDLCVRCGLCSYVCPSKIDLRRQFMQAQQVLKEYAESESTRERPE